MLDGATDTTFKALKMELIEENDSAMTTQLLSHPAFGKLCEVSIDLDAMDTDQYSISRIMLDQGFG